jgi:hypothetical protein
MQSRIEFIGGPKDGEIMYGRVKFFAKEWFCPVDESQPAVKFVDADYHIYHLTPTHLANESNYLYQGIGKIA